MGARADAAKSDGCATTDRSNGNSDFQSRGDHDQRRIVVSRVTVIASARAIAELLPLIQRNRRVAIDTEADSLHCYREKLCLVQVSVPEGDFLVDPLAATDLSALASLLSKKEIVLHGADYDLRLLRRALHFQSRSVFDTAIAARLLGIREFSYA